MFFPCILVPHQKDSSTGMTITSSIVTAIEASLRHDVGVLANVDGPPKDGPTQDLFTIAFFDFGMPPSVVTLFLAMPLSASSDTFIPAKETK